MASTRRRPPSRASVGGCAPAGSNTKPTPCRASGLPSTWASSSGRVSSRSACAGTAMRTTTEGLANPASFAAIGPSSRTRRARRRAWRPECVPRPRGCRARCGPKGSAAGREAPRIPGPCGPARRCGRPGTRPRRPSAPSASDRGSVTQLDMEAKRRRWHGACPPGPFWLTAKGYAGRRAGSKPQRFT